MESEESYPYRINSQQLLDNAVVAYIKEEPDDAPDETISNDYCPPLNEYGEIDAVNIDVVTFLNVTLENNSDDDQLCSSDVEPVQCAEHNIEKCSECNLNLPFTCMICKKGFRTYRSLFVHSKLHVQNFESLNKPRCKICNKKFDARKLTRHFNAHHVEKPFPCYYCDSSYFTKEQLEEHVRGHTGEKIFTCNHCNQRFEKESDLKSHYKTHTEEFPYACSICDEKFSTIPDLSRHITTHKKKKF